MPEADKAHQADKIAVQVDGRPLALTNLAKVLYPADGFTKAEVLDYYQRISPVLLPHIAGRPMTLRRYPHGVADLSFFAKHAPAHRPDSPFDGPVPAEYARPAVWVEPRLVIEVTFDRWTRAGRMRAPAYRGLRDDKDPADVVRET